MTVKMKRMDLLSPLNPSECHQRLTTSVVSQTELLPFWNWGPNKVRGSLTTNGFEIWLPRRSAATGPHGRPFSVIGTLSPEGSGTRIHLEYENPVSAEYIFHFVWFGYGNKLGGIGIFLGLGLVIFAASSEAITNSVDRALISAGISMLICIMIFYFWAHYECRLVRFLKKELDAH